MRRFKGNICILVLFIGPFWVMSAEKTFQQESKVADSIDTLVVTDEVTSDWHDYIEEMAENGIEGDQLEERLVELASDPIPLNNASREMLESIPILNEEQVENLSYYLYRYGPIVSISELLLVEGMDAQTMKWLKPFVKVDAVEETLIDIPPMKKALRFGKQEMRWTWGSTLQKKAGFENESDSTAYYLGDPVHAAFRYGFNYKGQLQWGVVLEKDPGELWWNANQSGFDYVSCHFLAKDSKRRNAVILGDYTVRFGQGLLCGNAFSLGKNTSGSIPEQTGPAFSRHFSTSENTFFRGVAVTLTLRPYRMEDSYPLGLELNTFVSVRKLDSSVENGHFAGINETGLHRTPEETVIQNRLQQDVLGSHLVIRWPKFSIGTTAVTWYYDATASKSLEYASIFNFSGKKGGDFSVDFRMMEHGILMFGELAMDCFGHIAVVVGSSFKPYPRMSISVLARNYSPQYQAIFSNAFSEGTSTRNEEGLYASTDVQLAKRLHLSGYVDVFRFPWLNYAVNTPSWGQDVAAELSSTIGRNGLVKLMLKCKNKEKSASDALYPMHPTWPYTKSQCRLQLSQKQGIWSIKTVLYANSYEYGNQPTSGFALAQDLGMESVGNRFAIQLHTVLFSTESWENRIYLWEKDVPGAFSMPMLYGHGCRMAVYARYDFKNVQLQIKVSDSVQPGMETLGDGLEQINGNRRTEARLQLSWKF
jgi:hypothetical protein